jgi:hypothetical protein
VVGKAIAFTLEAKDQAALPATRVYPPGAPARECLVDVDEWLHFFAINHAAGNWDSVGYRNCQDTYGYKPPNGRWTWWPWG